MTQRSLSQRTLSQKSKKRSNTIDNSVYEEGTQKSKDRLSEEEFELAVLNVTRFLLCDLRMKRKFRKEDIVVNTLNKSAKQYNMIMKEVFIILSKNFGLQIVKLPKNDDSFIIVHKHGARLNELTSELPSEGERQDRSILTVVLSAILLNRGQMYLEHVMVFLETIGFLSDKFFDETCTRKMKDHVPALIKNVFVKEMYLESTMAPRPVQELNPPLPEGVTKVMVLEWGFRTYLEVNVEKIVSFLTEINDGNRPPGLSSAYLKELKEKQQKIRGEAHIG